MKLTWQVSMLTIFLKALSYFAQSITVTLIRSKAVKFNSSSWICKNTILRYTWMVRSPWVHVKGYLGTAKEKYRSVAAWNRWTCTGTNSHLHVTIKGHSSPEVNTGSDRSGHSVILFLLSARPYHKSQKRHVDRRSAIGLNFRRVTAPNAHQTKCPSSSNANYLFVVVHFIFGLDHWIVKSGGSTICLTDRYLRVLTPSKVSPVTPRISNNILQAATSCTFGTRT